MPPDMSGFDSLPKHYDPPAAESFYDIWEKAGHFSSDPVAGRDNYSILLPPAQCHRHFAHGARLSAYPDGRACPLS